MTQSSSSSALLSDIRFGRRLNDSEWQGYTSTIESAKKALGKAHVGLITPIRSLPSDPDTGMGNLSGAARAGFFEFIRKLGFDTVQIDPDGKTKSVDASPYNATAFSASPLQIDLKPLVELGLLEAADVQQLVDANPHQSDKQAAYDELYHPQEAALKKAYGAFKAQLAGSPTDEVKILNGGFEAFKQKHAAWLETDALYETLTAEYNNDYYPVWSGPTSELDKRLMAPVTGDEAKAAARITALKQKHADTYESYQFAQFIADQQKQAVKAELKKLGMKIMGDRQVAFSDRDVWANPDVFLTDYVLGAAPDMFSKTGQPWGFAALNPDSLFNADGSLGKGGQLLQRLVEKILDDTPDGFRLDHAVGWIDPWVYLKGKGATAEAGAARLYSSPNHPVLGQYAKVRADQLNPQAKPSDEDYIQPDSLTSEQVTAYAALIEKVIFPVLKKRGLDKESVIFEDLGTLTTPVRQVLKALDTTGIRVTQFVDPPSKPTDLYRAKWVEPKQWATPGTHDNFAIHNWFASLPADKKQAHAVQLAEDIMPDADSAARQWAVGEWVGDARKFATAKFAELLASPARNLQFFFADWLGYNETYNTPNATRKENPYNWVLRMPQNVPDDYFARVKNREALNMPKVLKQAFEARGQQFVTTNQGVYDQLKQWDDTLEA